MIGAQIRGENAHHIIEASFKALGRAIRQQLDKSLKLPAVTGLDRKGSRNRITNETKISVSVGLDSTPRVEAIT